MAKNDKKKPKPVDVGTESGASRVRLNQQQFLIENMDLLAAPYTGTPDWEKRKVPKNKVYDHIIPINLSSADLISRLNRTSGAEDFLTASSDELSSLVPSIRLYMPTTATKGGKTVIEESLVYFGNYIKRGENGIGPSAYSHTNGPPGEEKFYESALGRGVGIKSFSYDQHTNHPGEKSMTAEVEIFFQSIADLASGPYIELIVPVLDPDNPSSPTNSVPKTDEEKKAKIEALKKAKSAVGSVLSKPTSPAATRMRAIIGWATPNVTPQSPLYNKRLAQFIKSGQETIILEMTKYNLTFGEAGEATLKISYVARADSSLTGPTSDILSGGAKSSGVTIPVKDLTNSYTLSGAYSDFESLDSESYVRKRYTQQRADQEGGNHEEELENIRLRPNKTRADIQLHSLALEIARLEFGDSENKSDKKKIEKAEAALELSKLFGAKVAAHSRAQRYGALLKKLNNSRKIFQLNIPEKYLGYSDNWGADTVTSDRSKFKGPKRKEQRRAVFGVARSGFSRISSEVAAAAKTTDSEDRDEAIKEAVEIEGSSKGSIKMTYMLLGDLLDAAYDLTVQSGKKSRGLMLGEFVLPKLMPGIKDKRYNIADIPISMAMFEAWFLQKIVKPQRDTYSYRAFVKDMLKALVEPAMNQEGLLKPRKPARKAGYSFYFTNFTTPVEFKKGQAYSASSPEIKKLPETKMVPERFNQSQYNDYLVILSREGFDGTGDYDEDAARGIYHLILGGDSGPVKSFSFTQQENKYMHAINMAGASTSNKISVLAIPQDAELNLVGTTLFKQGSLIFIDAEFALGKEVAKKLKIGGYYFISKVTHDLSPDKYETKLKCIWHNDYQDKPVDSKSKGQVKSEKAGAN
jgi:hypothetical protein